MKTYCSRCIVSIYNFNFLNVMALVYVNCMDLESPAHESGVKETEDSCKSLRFCLST